MAKICLMSDNHGDRGSMMRVLYANPDCDYYLHCGDSEMREDEVKPFLCVTGNNDYFARFPKYKVLSIEGHRILLIHGHRLVSPYSMDLLVEAAKEKECDLVFFGHIHMYRDLEVEGIRFINPGSTFYNRDYSEPCYAIVEINGKKVDVKRVILSNSVDLR